jgi:hypothetical protein
MDQAMNPLLSDFLKVNESKSSRTRDGAADLLLAALHEAGHWAAYAHHKIPVTLASVDRTHYGQGIVIPTDFCGLISDKDVPRVDLFCTMAGIAVTEYFCSRQLNFDTGDGDIKAGKKILDDLFGSDKIGPNKIARDKFRNACMDELKVFIETNWAVIEGLAYALMKHGKLRMGALRNVEKRLGIGNHKLTPTRIASAVKYKAQFNSHPKELLSQLPQNFIKDLDVRFETSRANAILAETDSDWLTKKNAEFLAKCAKSKKSLFYKGNRCVA